MRLAALLIWMVWVGIITLFPFDFGITDGRRFIEHPLAQRLTDFPLNVFLFLPLGALWHSGGKHRSMGLPSILLLSSATGATTSLTVEFLQLYLPSRFPSVIDVVANSAGAVAGVYLHRKWAASAVAGVSRLRNAVSQGYVVGIMAAFATFALLVSATLQGLTRLSNWDVSYPLLVGNEQTGDRSWRGRVYSIELTDAATTVASLWRFAEGRSTVIPGRVVAAFDLTGSAPYQDRSGHVPNLTWTVSSAAHGQYVETTPKHAWLRTEGPASLGRRLHETNAFTLRVRCATDDVAQSGPARIVSNSLDAGHRNLTLGQSGPFLSIRVRTPHTGKNALNPEFGIPAVFTDREVQDILVTYNGARVQAAVAKSGSVHDFELTPGSSLAAAATSSQVLAQDLQVYKIAYIACLFIPTGVLVQIFGRSGRDRLAWSGFWVLGFPFLFEAALVQVSGKPFELTNVATTGAVGALVILATVIIPSGLAEPGRTSQRTVQPRAVVL
jgi:hypothetical protein